jgi:hypothetical protein
MILTLGFGGSKAKGDSLAETQGRGEMPFEWATPVPSWPRERTGFDLGYGQIKGLDLSPSREAAKEKL